MRKSSHYARENRALIRFFVMHFVVGLIAGEALLAGLLLTGAGGLRTLIWHSSDQVLALALLAFFFAISFSSLAMGSGVMGLRTRKEENRMQHKPAADRIDPEDDAP